MSSIDVIADYVGMVKNQKAMIKAVHADPNAPVDGAIGLEAQLKRFRDEKRDEVILALASHVLQQVGE